MNGDIEEQNLNGNSIKERKEVPKKMKIPKYLNANSVFRLKFKIKVHFFAGERCKRQDGSQTVKVYGAFNIVPTLSYSGWKFLY